MKFKDYLDKNKIQEDVKIDTSQKELATTPHVVKPVIIEAVVPVETPKENKQSIDDISKYLKPNATFQQPNPEVVDPSMRAVQDKIKFLESWLGKVSIAGSGSGEVNFRYLDDINRSTMTPSNDNWVLEYDATTKKAQFTNKVGPLAHLILDTTHTDDGLEPIGTVSWNFPDRTANIHHANGVVQQVGQETYYLVKNTTGSEIINGTVCMFAGAEDTTEARLLAQPMVSDGTYPSVYIMGVATENIANNGIGFITSFGRVGDMNTTGGAENWQVGNLLYASPTVPGGLTNVKPTAPNNVILTAAVLHVGTTDGQIFVRPTIEQRMLYGRFSSSTDQTPALANTPYAILYDTLEVANGFNIDGGAYPASTVFVEESGFYSLTATLSLTSTNASAKAFYVWLRKNGVDVPISAHRQSVDGNNTYQILNYNFTISLNANDYFEIMYASSDTTISINSPPATGFSPAIPSVTLLITQVAL